MKGILFKEEMFVAATRLVNPKTQTRRIGSGLYDINLQPDNFRLKSHITGTGIEAFLFEHEISKNVTKVKPAYNLTETVFLKEAFQIKGYSAVTRQATVEYKFGGSETRTVNISKKTADRLGRWKSIGTWVSPMMMFSDFARYTAEITNMRCERLQTISDFDCEAEGFSFLDLPPPLLYQYTVSQIDESIQRYWYRHLINDINGPETWEQNPWLFVYDFKLTKP